MNIVYGGSFNPPTLAHYLIVQTIKEKFSPENVIVLPVGNSYEEKTLLSSEERINMLKLMFGNEVLISDIETNTACYEGTYRTLQKLSKNYEDIYFIMGADNIINITKWKNYKKLLEEYKFIVISRDNIDIKEYLNDELIPYKDNFEIINFKSDISSTKVREDVDLNKDMLHNKVYKYIKSKNLY